MGPTERSPLREHLSSLRPAGRRARGRRVAPRGRRSHRPCGFCKFVCVLPGCSASIRKPCPNVTDAPATGSAGAKLRIKNANATARKSQTVRGGRRGGGRDGAQTERSERTGPPAPSPALCARFPRHSVLRLEKPLLSGAPESSALGGFLKPCPKASARGPRGTR